jgi:hypothetical protein
VAVAPRQVAKLIPMQMVDAQAPQGAARGLSQGNATGGA